MKKRTEEKESIGKKKATSISSAYAEKSFKNMLEYFRAVSGEHYNIPAA